MTVLSAFSSQTNSSFPQGRGGGWGVCWREGVGLLTQTQMSTPDLARKQEED